MGLTKHFAVKTAKAMFVQYPAIESKCTLQFTECTRNVCLYFFSIYNSFFNLPKPKQKGYKKGKSKYSRNYVYRKNERVKRHSKVAISIRCCFRGLLVPATRISNSWICFHWKWIVLHLSLEVICFKQIPHKENGRWPSCISKKLDLDVISVL